MSGTAHMETTGRLGLCQDMAMVQWCVVSTRRVLPCLTGRVQVRVFPDVRAAAP